MIKCRLAIMIQFLQVLNDTVPITSIELTDNLCERMRLREPRRLFLLFDGSEVIHIGANQLG